MAAKSFLALTIANGVLALLLGLPRRGDGERALLLLLLGLGLRLCLRVFPFLPFWSFGFSALASFLACFLRRRLWLSLLWLSLWLSSLWLSSLRLRRPSCQGRGACQAITRCTWRRSAASSGRSRRPNARGASARSGLRHAAEASTMVCARPTAGVARRGLRSRGVQKASARAARIPW